MLSSLVGGGQVEAAVASEVARHDGGWVGPDRIGDRGLESTVAVAQQHGDVVGIIVGHGQVDVAVTREVTGNDGPWVRPSRVLDRGLEGAVAVAQEHRDFARIGAGDVVELAEPATARSSLPSPLNSPATMRG